MVRKWKSLGLTILGAHFLYLHALTGNPNFTKLLTYPLQTYLFPSHPGRSLILDDFTAAKDPCLQTPVPDHPQNGQDAAAGKTLDIA